MEKRNQVEIAANIDPRTVARSLYWQGWRISAIGRHLGIKPATVHSWKQRENWDGGSPIQRVAASVEARLIQLIHLPKKSDGDYKEIRQLSGLIQGAAEKMPSEKSAAKPSAEKFIADLTDNIPTIDNPPRERAERGRDAKERPAGKPHKNFLHPDQIKRMEEIFIEQSFGYQRFWNQQYGKRRFRNLLKSRQIGATFYFAREAFLNSLKTGINSIFLSASRAQAYYFRRYILDLAAMVDAELKGGDVIQLHNGAELYFLGTNSRTAQGRNGNLYVDEYFWIEDFENLRKLASPMASQAHLKTTYFSTPSYEAHPAYTFWSGEFYNKNRPKNEHISLDVSPAALKHGRLDPDGQFRHVVTIHDALTDGCHLFNIDDLRREYPPHEFRQLFECEFVAAKDGVFDFAELQKCGVDSWDAWADWYKSFAPKPCGDAPVWIGYDPSHTGDAAGLVVATAPVRGRDKFCVVQKTLLQGADFESQAAFIRNLLSVYNVQKIVIDSNGIGVAVADLVKKFFPGVICMTYTPEIKGLMVLKMLNLLKNRRVEWDGGDIDMQMAFLSVRRTMTASGRHMTYETARTKEASHGDLAWAAMMLFYQEPLDGVAHGRVEIDS
ncbi:oxidoreductase [Neisseria sp. N95_16]|uniref:Oxidoreductase n=1 Tax=Neisseria brasiliensis TaxID=2666100 RepID=A0A5Q3RUX7_9NEIS|nr:MULTISPECIES: terminase family protein [Neisseria]MRN37188.1 oxidoreductase [Neisseria brasiliensis]PJO10092.1 oxidoreductase [Neisseria sp. N95_16]PJO78756.1 oxidoreductase [Neisseria sp. N177_16]QGL24197.1 oxidoreductase [Neisseria brasiliensis]